MYKRKRINFFQFWGLFILIFLISVLIRLLVDNTTRKAFFVINTSLIGSIYRTIAHWDERVFFYDKNAKLFDENQLLKRKQFQSLFVRDSCEHIYQSPYTIFCDGRIIASPIHKNDNFLIVDVGKDDGVEEGMTVVEDGTCLVGKVYVSTSHFSKILPIINTKLQVSAKIKSSNFNLGMIVWDRNNYRQVLVENIPFNEDVNIGDTVITTGFSTTIPPNLGVGKVIAKEQGENAYDYRLVVELFVNYKRLHTVEVLKNENKEELDTLLKE